MRGVVQRCFGHSDAFTGGKCLPPNAEPRSILVQLACVRTQQAPRCGQHWAAALWIQQYGSMRSHALWHWNPRQLMRGLRLVDSTVPTVHPSSALDTGSGRLFDLCSDVMAVCEHHYKNAMCLYFAAVRCAGSSLPCRTKT